nr:hypothetical protein OG409_08020 [Streptomyces sp. NBC_00974]
MSTPTPRDKIARPEGVLLVKSAGGGRAHASGATDSTVFVVFPDGMVRRLTAVEAACWTDAGIDHLIPVGRANDPAWLDLVAYDNALRA